MPTTIRRSQSLPTPSTQAAHDAASPIAHSASMPQPQSAQHTDKINEIAQNLLQICQTERTANAVEMEQIREILALCEVSIDNFIAANRQALANEGQEIIDVVNVLVEPGTTMTGSTREGSPARFVANELDQLLSAAQESRDAQPLTLRERALVILDFLQEQLRLITRNEYQTVSGRWGANLVNDAVRTALVVAVATTVRQLVGFAAERAAILDDAPNLTREIIGGIAVYLGTGLNLAGFIRDELNHTATPQSRTARLSMALMSTGALLFAAYTGSPSVLSTSMATFTQGATYCVLRDIANLFLGMNSSAPITLGGAIAAGAVYSGLQVALGEAMSRLAPNSGAGYVDAVANQAAHGAEHYESSTEAMVQWFTEAITDNITGASAPTTEAVADRVHSAVSALQPDIPHDFIRGALNGIVESADDLVGGAIRLAIQGIPDRETESLESASDGRPAAASQGLRISINPLIPSRTTVADQFLTTNAMRYSMLQNIFAVTITAALRLSETSLSNEAQWYINNAITAVVVSMVYAPFLMAHVQRAGEPEQAAIAPARDENSAAPNETTGLRRRPPREQPD